MDYETLHLSQISLIFPKQRQIEASSNFIYQFLHALPLNMQPRIEAYLEEQFSDILLGALRDDEIFRNLAANAAVAADKLLYNYFIMNYSSYLQERLVSELFEYSRALSHLVALDGKLWTPKLLRYLTFVCCIRDGKRVLVDVAKSLFVVRFWQKVYRWINLQVHYTTVRLRERYFCEEEFSGLESKPTQTCQLADCQRFAPRFGETRHRNWEQFLREDDDCALPEYAPDSDTTQQIVGERADKLGDSVFDVLYSDFDW